LGILLSYPGSTPITDQFDSKLMVKDHESVLVFLAKISDNNNTALDSHLQQTRKDIYNHLQHAKDTEDNLNESS